MSAMRLAMEIAKVQFGILSLLLSAWSCSAGGAFAAFATFAAEAPLLPEQLLEAAPNAGGAVVGRAGYTSWLVFMSWPHPAAW